MTLVDISYLVKANGANDIRLPLKINYYNEESEKLAIETAKAVGELILK